jgi:hypothetical protein
MLCFALVMGATLRAGAEVSEVDRQQARALALQGYEALQRKDYATAESCFRRADQLVHAPTLVLDHARSLVGLGRLVEAHERYELVLREGVSPTAPRSWKRAFEEAGDEIEALKPRLAWLTVTVVGPDKPVVFIDGRRVPAAAVGVPRAVNPGHRTVSARARGYYQKQQELILADGQRLTLEFRLTPRPPSEPEEPEETAPAAVAATEASTEEEIAPTVSGGPPPPPGGVRRTLGYVAMTVGGVGLVVGGVTGVLALNARSDLSHQCPNRVCVPLNEGERTRDSEDIDRYDLFRTASSIGFGVGVVGAVAGTYLLFFGRGEESAKIVANRVTLTPLLGPGRVGLEGSF